MDTPGAHHVGGGFQVDITYIFNPPVRTRCIHIHEPREWQEQTFSRGTCIGLDSGYYVFRGVSHGDNLLRDFLIRCDKGGSVARIVGKPKLTILQGSKK